jgi:hypothetical protein
MVDALKKKCICIFLLISLFGCKKNNSELELIGSNQIDTNLLFGTWELIPKSNYYSLYFNQEHRLLQDHGSSSLIWKLPGYWKWVDGHELLLTGSMFPVPAKIVKLTADSLVLYAFNTNYRHRRIATPNDPYGIRTLVGTGQPFTSDLPSDPRAIGMDANDLAEDGRGNIYIADSSNDRIKFFDKTANLVTTLLKIDNPKNIALDKNGDLIIISDHKIVRYSPTAQTVKTLVSELYISELAIDKNGDIYYIYDIIGKPQLKRIDHLTGISSPVTGFSYHPAPATLKEVTSMKALASDRDGNIYLGTGTLGSTGSPGAVWKYNVDDNMVQLIIGDDIRRSEGDGKIATEASLRDTQSLAVDNEYNIYIGDYNIIRRIDARTKVITRIAGNLNTTTMSGDWTNATWADLTLIRGLTANSNGEVIFLDKVNFKVRKLYRK